MSRSSKRFFLALCSAAFAIAVFTAILPARSSAQTSDIPAAEHKVAKGRVMVSLQWGTGENSVGRASEADAVHSFVSPTSFIAKDDIVYILDSPNFRILKVNSRTGSIEARAALAEKSSGEVMLYTDIAIMPQGFLAVSSSREKMILLFTPELRPAGKIKPEAPVGLITKISTDDKGAILIEDPVAEKYFITDASGKLITTAAIECQPTFLRDGRLVRFEIADSAKPPFKVTAKVFSPVAAATGEKGAAESKYEFEFEKPVQNLILLGETGRVALHVYAVLGASGDVPEAARTIKVSQTGKVIESLDAPISPSMATMRYVRESEGGNVLFASGDEERYIISQYSYKK